MASIAIRRDRHEYGTIVKDYVRAVLPAFVVSRVLVFAIALLLEITSAAGAERPLVMPKGAPLALLTASWDSIWYAGVAASGYSTSPETSQFQNYAYLPLFPATEWLLAQVTGLSNLPWGYNIAGTLLSHFYFLVTLVVLYAFARRLGFSTLTSLTCTWLLCALPWSFIFSTGYSESLFILLAGSALFVGFEATLRLFTREHGSAVLSLCAGLLAGLASVTRAQGIVVALAVFSMLVAGVVLAGAGRATTPRYARSLLRRAWVPLLGLVPTVLLLGGFIAYIGLLTGNVTAAMTIRTAWGTGWLGDLKWLAAGPFADNGLRMGEWLSFVSLLIWCVLVVVALVYFGRWVRSGAAAIRPTSLAHEHEPNSSVSLGDGSRSQARQTDNDVLRAAVAVGLLIYVLGYFLVSLVTNVGNGGWGRYLVVSFPLVWALAPWLSSPRVLRYAVYVLLGSQVLLLAAMVLKHYVP